VTQRSGGENLHAVRAERRVARDDHGAEPRGLGNEHPVEGIAVVRRQARGSVRVGKRDRQAVEARRLDRSDQVVGCLELAQGALDPDLPDGGGRDER
jgi:hypothetical protein